MAVIFASSGFRVLGLAGGSSGGGGGFAAGGGVGFVGGGGGAGGGGVGEHPASPRIATVANVLVAT
jgi:hypothetical protein